MRQKANGQMSSAEIVESMGVSDRWARRLWSRYGSTRPEDITWPPRMGRPVEGLPGTLRGVVLLQPRQTHGREA